VYSSDYEPDSAERHRLCIVDVRVTQTGVGEDKLGRTSATAAVLLASQADTDDDADDHDEQNDNRQNAHYNSDVRVTHSASRRVDLHHSVVGVYSHEHVQVWLACTVLQRHSNA